MVEEQSNEIRCNGHGIRGQRKGIRLVTIRLPDETVKKFYGEKLFELSIMSGSWLHLKSESSPITILVFSPNIFSCETNN